jgi:hypothetical protein
MAINTLIKFIIKNPILLMLRMNKTLKESRGRTLVYKLTWVKVF